MEDSKIKENTSINSNEVAQPEHPVKSVNTDQGPWPTILIILGIVLLLWNFDVLNERVFDIIKKFWPAVLIYIGLDKLTANRPRMRMVTSIVMISLVVFLILLLSEGNFSLRR